MSAYFIDVIAGPAAGGYLKIRPQEIRVIGRSRATDLHLNDDLVSAQHLLVSYRDGLQVQDLRTTNGTLLHRAGGAMVPVNDATHPWHEEDLIQIGAHVLQVRPAHIAAAQVTTTQVTTTQVTPTGSGIAVVQLSPPHTKPPQPPELDPPPDPPQAPARRRIPWVAMVTSALGGLVMAALFRTAFLLVFSVLAPAGMLLQFLWEKRRQSREYAQALAEHEALRAAHRTESCARQVVIARHNRLQATDPAFCHRQISVPTVELWQFTNQPVSEWQLLLGLIRDGAALQPFHVPVAAGTIGIFGDPTPVAALTRWLALQIAANYAPSRAHITGPWDWLAHLPHGVERPEAFRFLPAPAQGPNSEAEHEIVFAHTRSQLPAHCGHVIEVRPDFTGVCEMLAQNVVQDLTLLCGLDSETAHRFARDLAPLRDPDSVPRRSRSLTQLWGEPDVEAISAHWEQMAGDPGRLRCLIGEDQNAQPFEIDLEVDGPHVLIGGTTGAGKSVLQRALVTSLALTQRPEHLAIVLVDYKGGAAFRCLEQLPHVIDVVTDLDESATVRTLASLRAELRRREELLATHNFSDHKQLAAAGLIALAPRLVLVVDELRALGDQHPELLIELVQLAALGRSLGVHLVLATQRPGSSVNADMRANINMRIALRVQSAADSHDILDLPDAAELPAERPGAALLRLGSGPARELQVAAITDAAATELAATIAQAAQQVGARAPRRPWLPPLPQVVTKLEAPGPEHVGPFQEIPAQNNPAQNSPAQPIAVGLRDHPMSLRQDVLAVTPGAGHLLIAGGPGSGRTTALRALARHSTVPVHVIARDPASVVDANAEWIGTRAPLEDQRLIARLAEQLLGQETAPRLVLVDDADWLIDPENSSVRTWNYLQELLRRGSARGITVALAGGRLLLTPRVSELLSTRWILNWADDTATTAGAVPRETAIPAGPGGIAEVRSGHVTAARIRWVPPPTESAWPTRGSGPLPGILRLQSLPAEVSASALLRATEAERINEGRAAPSKIVLGIGGDHAEPVYLPLTSLLLAGPPGSGRTNALTLIIQQCARAGREVVLIASDAAATPRAGAARIVPPEGATGALEGVGDGAVVLVDDLDLALSWDPHAPWVEALRRRVHEGQPTIATATVSAAASSYSGVLAQLRRRRTGIVLHPGDRLANDVFGVDVAREADTDSTSAGRGVVVDAGVVTALQMARSDP